MSDNEDFHEPVDATALELEILHGLDVPSGPQRAVLHRIGRMFADRDRAREDFFNGHVLRKTYGAEFDYGAVTPGPKVGAQTVVLPGFSLQFTKAQTHSALDMYVVHSGVFDGAAHKNISVDVLFSDLAGLLLQSAPGVAMTECGGTANPSGCQLVGRRVVNPGTGLDRGIYVATLAVNIPAAATWTALQNTQLTLTETP